MNIIEIVGGVLLLITVVLATILCIMQDQNRDQNMDFADRLLCCHTTGKHSSDLY